jgi:hypothetical protein
MDTLPDMNLEDRMPSSQGRRLNWRTQPTRRLASRAAEAYISPERGSAADNKSPRQPLLSSSSLTGFVILGSRVRIEPGQRGAGSGGVGEPADVDFATMVGVAACRDPS